jgi:hypothetical protein
MKTIQELRKEFMAEIMHQAWMSYQLGANQSRECDPNEYINSTVDSIKFLDEYFQVYLDINDNKFNYKLFVYHACEESHINWMKFKQENGWKYGPVKSFEKKEHPDMVPYDQLLEVEKRKDQNNVEAYLLTRELWNKYCVIKDKK